MYEAVEMDTGSPNPATETFHNEKEKPQRQRRFCRWSLCSLRVAMGCVCAKLDADFGHEHDDSGWKVQRSRDGRTDAERLLSLCDGERFGALEGYLAFGGDPNIQCEDKQLTQVTATMLAFAATANRIRIVDLLLRQQGREEV